MKKSTQGNIMLLIATLIWGSAFVAQSAGMDYVGPFTYNTCRNFIGFIVLIPVTLIFRHNNASLKAMSHTEKNACNKMSVIGGICCGVVLAIASGFQQVGVSMTTAGKAGFITALYIVIVPLLGIFLKKKVPKRVWPCVLVALLGFYLLCIKSDFTLGIGDFYCLLNAFWFAMHIVVIDYFANKNTDGVTLSCIQLFVAGVVSMILTLIFREQPQFSQILAAKYAILYAGVLSSGVAFTLQVVAQKYTKPEISSLLMSLESVFAALSGWIILHETMTLKELFGCGLVFCAAIVAECGGSIVKWVQNRRAKI